MVDIDSQELINENIFSRSIFGKASKDEMESILKSYTDKEDYERCLVIKELLDLEYYREDPKKDDFVKLTKIIEGHENELDELSVISDKLIEMFDDNNIDIKSSKKISSILNEIDDVSDEIIYNILESDKLREEYLTMIYNEILDENIPPVKKDKTKKLINDYRNENIKNIEKVLKSYKKIDPDI